MKNHSSELAKSLRNGCQDAFEKIYHLYHAKIYGFCIRYGLSAVDSEEITQEVFIKIWESREKINPEKNFHSYFLTISRNLVIDHIKARIKKQAAEEYKMNFLHPVNDVELDMDFRDLQNRIEHTLLKLPERRREVFELSKIHGLSHKEISRQLGISVKTVENHLAMAMQDFKVAFGGGGGACLLILLHFFQDFL